MLSACLRRVSGGAGYVFWQRIPVDQLSLHRGISVRHFDAAVRRLGGLAKIGGCFATVDGRFFMAELDHSVRLARVFLCAASPGARYRQYDLCWRWAADGTVLAGRQ